MGVISIIRKAEVAEDQKKATQRSLTTAVQRHMDEVAGRRNYDNIISCCSYATSLNPKFSAEGQAAVEWRDDVWVTCYGLLDEVMDGTRPIPAEQELIAMLPVIQWPEAST